MSRGKGWRGLFFLVALGLVRSCCSDSTWQQTATGPDYGGSNSPTGFFPFPDPLPIQAKEALWRSSRIFLVRSTRCHARFQPKNLSVPSTASLSVPSTTGKIIARHRY